MGRMDGKGAVVTGAASGIGKGIADMFALEGAKVVYADYDVAGGEAAVAEIKAAGGEAIFVKTDVRKKEDIQNCLKATIEAYGDVSTLVNSAGVLVHAPFLEHTDADFDKLTEINFRGYYWMMQEFLPALVKNGKASILNIASISVHKPETYAYLYGAYKAAVNIMTKNLIREFTPQGVRLNVICPGPVMTMLTPEPVRKSKELQEQLVKDVCPCGRPGDPKDIAYAATWLCSDEAEWVTGSTIVVDGGASNMG